MKHTRIKVACIGDSITEGDVGGGVNSAVSYPSQLQNLLGEGYEIRNFGKCGFSVSKNAMNSYWTLEEFKTSQEYQPDIIIMMLGTNDVWCENWKNVKDEFEDDYTEFINLYKGLASKPTIYLTKVCGVYGEDRAELPRVNACIQKIAEHTQSRLADMFTWTDQLSAQEKAQYFPDTLHPNAEGYTIMARQFKEQIFDPLERKGTGREVL